MLQGCFFFFLIVKIPLICPGDKTIFLSLWKEINWRSISLFTPLAVEAATLTFFDSFTSSTIQVDFFGHDYNSFYSLSREVARQKHNLPTWGSCMVLRYEGECNA